MGSSSCFILHNQQQTRLVLVSQICNLKVISFFFFITLCRINEPSLTEAEQQNSEVENADRSFFLQDLILSTLNDSDKESDSSLEFDDDALGGGSSRGRRSEWKSESSKEVLLHQLESLNLKDKDGPA